MDVLQINPTQFLFQVIGLGAWILAAALIYSIVEKFMGGPAPPDEEQKL